MAGRNRRAFLWAGFGLGLIALGAGSSVYLPPSHPAPMEEILETVAEGTVEAGLPLDWDLTVTRNERVENWIDFLAGRNADRTRLWLERSGRYAPMILEELRSRGMPQDLLYLAFIESGFSPRAYSKAAASGIWQFIEETGRRYGLEVSDEVDERRDPIAATRAALDYLGDLHDRFGSWYLAAAAYNTGENRVDRILRERVGGDRGADTLFWRIAPYLPQETRDYVPLMLAAGHIGKAPDQFGFADVSYQDPLDFASVWVPGAVSFEAIGKSAGVDVEVIRELNPHLIKGRTPTGRGWQVRIPSGSEARFAAAFPAVYRGERARLARAEHSSRSHTVKSGETFSHIAVRYGVSVAALEAANSGISARRLRPGQHLRIPSGSAKSAPAFHRVRSGENLTIIAQRYDVSIAQLRLWNRMGRSSLVKAGQRLKVSG